MQTLLRRITVRHLAILASLMAVAALALGLLANLVVIRGAQPHIKQPVALPKAQAAIVLGARVFPGDGLSHVLADRVDTAIDLYNAGKVEKLLLTGDHGRTSYDEVNAMRRHALAKGIPAKDIFMDHAGFNTYESMYRARDVFKVRRAIVVTQRFHLARSVYTARVLGIGAVGVEADRHIYSKAAQFDAREALARVKALLQLYITRPRPTFLGPVIPITGDGRATNDRPD